MEREEGSSSHSSRSLHRSQTSAILPESSLSLLSLGSALARRLFINYLPSTGRLHLSISSQPNVPIIAESPSSFTATTTTTNHASRQSSGALSPSFQSPPLPPPPSTTTNININTTQQSSAVDSGSLVEAEAGFSRRLTHQEGEGEEEDDNDPTISNLAAEAERLRLTTSTPISSLDIRSIARSLERSLPFIILVLLVFVFHHLRHIVLYALGTHMLHRCNIIMQQQIARKADIQRRVVVSSVFSLLAYATALQYLVGIPHGMWRLLTFRGGAPLGTQFWQIFFTVVLVDLFLRLCLAATKGLVVSVVRADSQFRCRRRGAVLTFLDYVIAVHRSLLPAPVWLQYFQASGFPWPVAISLSGLYLVSKAPSVLERILVAGVAAVQLRGGGNGTAPTPEELASAPRECAICQDEIKHPLRLVCGHIFCEECVEEWLAREASCPMCRREVRRATMKPRGDGATSVFPMLC